MDTSGIAIGPAQIMIDGKLNLRPARSQLSDAPVRLRSLFFRKEIQIAALIGALLVIVPVWINYNQRAERIGRAILNGHDETAEKIITAYPKLLNSRDASNGFTPLHWAVIARHTNLVFWLIEKGAEINAADPAGMTPLHKAAVFNRLTCAEALVKAGADVSVMGRKYGVLRLAPLHLAAEEGHDEMVKFLLSQCADVNAPTEGANRITPLHFAAAKGHAAVVETLITAGADINACDYARKTPLTWAIESEQRNTTDILRKAGAVP
ncbi:MAG: ankyrin repeat domain-containing protein [Kiritimatiellia bacterium]|nr:ankyrin repeat domain-containing protein [Kiritimatiellia bacterium]